MKITPFYIAYIIVVVCIGVSNGIPVNGVEKTADVDKAHHDTIMGLLNTGAVYDWEVYEDRLKLFIDNYDPYELPGYIFSEITEYQESEPETGLDNGSEVPDILSGESVDPGSRKLVLKEHEKELNNSSPLTLSLDFMMKNTKRKSVLVSTVRLYEFDE